MKKNIGIFLIIIIVLGILSGCSIHKSSAKRIKQESRDRVEVYRIA